MKRLIIEKFEKQLVIAKTAASAALSAERKINVAREE